MNSTFEFSELLTKQQIVSRQCGGPTGAARRTDKAKRDLSPGIPQGLQRLHHFLNLQIELLLLGKAKRDLSPGIPQGLQLLHHFLNLRIELLLLGKAKRDLSPGIPQGLQLLHQFLNLQIELLLLLGPVAKTPRNKSPLQLTAPVFKCRTHRQPTNTLMLQFPQVTKHAVVERTQNQVYPLTLKIIDSKFCGP